MMLPLSTIEDKETEEVQDQASGGKLRPTWGRKL